MKNRKKSVLDLLGNQESLSPKDLLGCVEALELSMKTQVEVRIATLPVQKESEESSRVNQRLPLESNLNTKLDT